MTSPVSYYTYDFDHDIYAFQGEPLEGDVETIAQRFDVSPNVLRDVVRHSARVAIRKVTFMDTPALLIALQKCDYNGVEDKPSASGELKVIFFTDKSPTWGAQAVTLEKPDFIIRAIKAVQAQNFPNIAAEAAAVDIIAAQYFEIWWTGILARLAAFQTA